MSCNGCDEIITTGNQGYDGWSPVLALSEDCAGKIVHRLISWIDGTGTKPDYNSNIMTDAWLLANPIYLSASGFTQDCDEAINLKPSNGTNGTNGSNGEQGLPGEDGCDPDITITANVVGDKTSPLEVISDTTNPCTPSYEINFPEEIFTSTAVVDAVTGSETFTTAVENAIDGVLNPTLSTNTSLTINNTGSPDIRYTSSSIISLNSLYRTPHISYTQIGNKMTLNFCITLTSTTLPINTITKLELKIPNSKICTNTTEAAAVGFAVNYTFTGWTGIPVITTNNIDSSYLIIQFPTNTTTSYPTIISGGLLTLQGQITITTN